MAIRDKFATNAQPYLQPGEQVQATIGGQTTNQWWVLVTVFILIFTNKYRIIVATDRRILILGGGRWTQTGVKEVVGEVPRSVAIGPASGLWWKCTSLGSPIYVHKRFHKDVAAADALRPGGEAPGWGQQAPSYGAPAQPPAAPMYGGTPENPYGAPQAPQPPQPGMPAMPPAPPAPPVAPQAPQPPQPPQADPNLIDGPTVVRPRPQTPPPAAPPAPPAPPSE